MSDIPEEKMAYIGDGYCPVCEKATIYRARFDWYRAHLICPLCKSVPRERAVALLIEEIAPGWRDLAIHESSPAGRGVSAKLAKEAKHYIASHYFPDLPFGSMVKRFQNEDLEAQTFGDEVFDLVVSLDVMEHVFQPWKVYQEVCRTLRPGGYYLHTFPIKKQQVEASKQRAELSESGVRHLVEKPEYHGNPINPSEGSLVTFDYGYDISRQIAEWAAFDVRISRFWDRTHGLMGEFTEVIVCRKPMPPGLLSVVSAPLGSEGNAQAKMLSGGAIQGKAAPELPDQARAGKSLDGGSGDIRPGNQVI